MTSPISVAIQAFNPKSQEHVKWLKNMSLKMKSAVNNVKQTPEFNRILDDNPFSVTFGHKHMVDLAELQIMMLAKYGQAVIDEDAYIPQP